MEQKLSALNLNFFVSNFLMIDSTFFFIYYDIGYNTLLLLLNHEKRETDFFIYLRSFVVLNRIKIDCLYALKLIDSSMVIR